MLNSEKVVEITDDDYGTSGGNELNVKGMKKSDYLKYKKETVKKIRDKLKPILEQYIGKQYDLKIDGNNVEVYLYRNGVEKILGDLSRDKSAAVVKFDEIIKNSEYVYSTTVDEKDNGKKNNIIRYDNFYCPLKTPSNDNVGVKVAVARFNGGDNNIYNLDTRKAQNKNEPVFNSGNLSSPSSTPSVTSTDSTNNTIPSPAENVNNSNNSQTNYDTQQTDADKTKTRNTVAPKLNIKYFEKLKGKEMSDNRSIKNKFTVQARIKLTDKNAVIYDYWRKHTDSEAYYLVNTLQSRSSIVNQMIGHTVGGKLFKKKVEGMQLNAKLENVGESYMQIMSDIADDPTKPPVVIFMTEAVSFLLFGIRSCRVKRQIYQAEELKLTAKWFGQPFFHPAKAALP